MQRTGSAGFPAGLPPTRLDAASAASAARTAAQTRWLLAGLAILGAVFKRADLLIGP
ncbi:hypothetical protein [Thiohalocapsa halophila]|uniref:hypothetical protein n=1 Tax=Thiohalocapsa halophila TaxID=69359 RepID=UPI0019065DD6|nr:hypothetical protein [Thiohalocapsa halophila]